MQGILELVKSNYENSLIKQLKKSPEEEMEKISGRKIFAPLGSTYNAPKSQTLYDLIGSLVSDYFLGYLNSRGQILVGSEGGLKSNVKFSDTYEAIYDILNKEKESKKNIRKSLNKFIKNIESETLENIDEFKRTYVEQLKFLRDNIEEIFGKDYLKNFISRSKRVGLYKIGNKDLEVLSNSLDRTYPSEVKTILPVKLEERTPLIKNYLITNYLLAGKEIGDRLDYLSSFAKELEEMDSNDLEKIFHTYLNTSKQYSPIIPLGTLIYLNFLPYTSRNELSLAVTNYTNPRDTKDFVERVEAIIYPGLKIYISKNNNFYLANNKNACDFLKKNNLLNDKSKLDNLINQVYEQVDKQLNSDYFKDIYAFTIVLKDFE